MNKDNRRTRLLGRHAQRRVTTLLRCFDCGRAPNGQAVGIRHTDETGAGFAGLSTCGKIWLCPVCNSKVMAKRALEIGLAVLWAERNGFQLIFGSLTIRHTAADELKSMVDLQRAAWRKVMQSKVWRRHSATSTVDHAHNSRCVDACGRKRDTVISGLVGRVGYIRATEINIGSNGWHPHYHPLVFFKGSADQAQRFADSLAREWVLSVESLGGEARLEGGQQLNVLNTHDVFDGLSTYLTKQTYGGEVIALELVWGQNKAVRPKGNTKRVSSTVPHWAILTELAKAPNRKFAELWYELEESAHELRAISWSRGLRSFVELSEVETTDEEVAAQEVGTVNDTVCFITPDGWATLRDNPQLQATLLETMEVHGWETLERELISNNVEYFVLQEADPTA